METESLKTFLMKDLYPATRDELLAGARDHGLDPDDYRRLEQIADREYETAAEVGYELEAARGARGQRH
jgi:hypothetical protein